MEEVWKISPTLPEYEVSSWGRIRRKPYTAPMPHGGTRTYGGKAWYGCNNTLNRRMTFRFRGKTYKVHQLICEAFNGPKPDNCEVCMHLDEDYTNNRPENLAWGTHKENLNAPGYIEWRRSTMDTKEKWLEQWT